MSHFLFTAGFHNRYLLDPFLNKGTICIAHSNEKRQPDVVPDVVMVRM